METTNAPDQANGGSSGLRQAMRKHPLFFFFLLTYLISWIFLSMEVLSVWGFLPNNSGFITFVNVLFTFGPTFAAIIMTNIVEGREGIQRLRDRIRLRRAGWQWYLFTLLGIPVLFLLGIIIQPGMLASFQGLTPLFLVTYALNFVGVWFGGGPLGEEIGWRGFALPRMQPRYGPLQGTLLLGVLWAFWHLPQFLTPYQGGGPGTGLATFLTNFSIFFFTILALAIIFTWIFNHTRGSIFMAITAHASVNTPTLVLAPLFLAMSFTTMNLAMLAGFGVMALAIVVLTRGRLGYPQNQEPLLKAEPDTGPAIT